MWEEARYQISVLVMMVYSNSMALLHLGDAFVQYLMNSFLSGLKTVPQQQIAIRTGPTGLARYVVERVGGERVSVNDGALT